jgi:phosphoribosylglycinamide formyltransferase 1
VTLELGVLVSGSGTNLAALIEATQTGRLDARIRVVVSNKPEAFALERARQAGLPTAVLEHKQFSSREAFDEKLAQVLKAHGAQWVALAGFMRVLTPQFLDQFRGKVVNIHPSLLPSFRGVDAQKQAYDYGVRVTGCTVHFVNAEVDGGAIILQRPVAVLENESLDSLRARILAEEHVAFVEALSSIASGRVKLLEAPGERERVVFFTSDESST